MQSLNGDASLRSLPSVGPKTAKGDRMTAIPNFAERAGSYRPSKTVFFWSCLACVAATIFVGFNWGGWVTGATAAQMATSAAEHARAELTAAVCVTQFDKGTDKTATLASLARTDSWKRGEFIEKGGWAALPGIDKPVSGAADLCAKQLTDAIASPAQGGLPQ